MGSCLWEESEGWILEATQPRNGSRTVMESSLADQPAPSHGRVRAFMSCRRDCTVVLYSHMQRRHDRTVQRTHPPLPLMRSSC